MSIQAIDILQSISGHVQPDDGSSANKSIKQATIDPSYNPLSFPGTLPKVTFDNETVLSTKFYPVASPYWPHPGERVWMVPIGTTYLIVGSINPQSGRLFVQASYIRDTRRRMATSRLTTNSGNITGETVVHTVQAANLVAGRWYEIGWYTGVGASTGNVLNFLARLKEDGNMLRQKREAAGSGSSVFEVDFRQEWQAPTNIPLKTFTGTLELGNTSASGQHIFRSSPSPAEASIMYVDYVRG